MMTGCLRYSRVSSIGIGGPRCCAASNLLAAGCYLGLLYSGLTLAERFWNTRVTMNPHNRTIVDLDSASAGLRVKCPNEDAWKASQPVR